MERTYRGRWPVTNSDQLRAYLAVHDAPCPKCRHSLRGIPDPRCPECGLELDVWSLHYRRRWLPEVAEVPHLPGVAIALNVLLAILVIASAASHRGAVPLLAWMAPGVIGAFACSLAYWPVLLKYQASTVEDPPQVASTAWMMVVLQTGGLILLWV